MPLRRRAGPAPGGRFGVQIGAYASVTEAQRALSSAQAKTGAQSRELSVRDAPLYQSLPAEIFRARFRGFDATAAAATCQKLRQTSLDCFVMSAQ